MLKLKQCLVRDTSHVTPGSVGDHVHDCEKVRSIHNSRSLAFKKARKIINFSYETQVDNIVGKMTIAALDREMVKVEQSPS